MPVYIRLFDTYNDYIAVKDELPLPNVSTCKEDLDTVFYNPAEEPETRVVAKYNVTDTSNPTPIGYYSYISGFSEIEIDGVELPSVVSAYTFSTTGEHTIKYTLTDPTLIDVCAFESCGNITSVTIPDSVTTIRQHAFRGCDGFTSITLPDSVTTIGNYAFYYCEALTSINIPNGVTSIGYHAFQFCTSLTGITIPDGVTNIGEETFDSDEALTTVTIGSGVTNINDYAFLYCTSLSSVTITATAPPTLGSSVFSNNASGRKIYVPSASVNTYKAASGWSTYASDIEAIQ